MECLTGTTRKVSTSPLDFLGVTVVDSVEENSTIQFLEAILGVESLDECRAFFQVLLTDAELEMIPLRWPIIQLLSQGSMTNKEIAAKVGVSTTTVSAVNTRLRRNRDPLKPLLERLEAKDTPRIHETLSDSPEKTPN